jgi:hypothetical protein
VRRKIYAEERPKMSSFNDLQGLEADHDITKELQLNLDIASYSVAYILQIYFAVLVT